MIALTLVGIICVAALCWLYYRTKAAFTFELANIFTRGGGSRYRAFIIDREIRATKARRKSK